MTIELTTSTNGYTRHFCSLCQRWTAICKTCGNNTCNGGGNCQDCHEAHEIDQDEARLMELPIGKLPEPTQELKDLIAAVFGDDVEAMPGNVVVNDISESS